MLGVIASEAKQSISPRTRNNGFASSQGLLAMTGLSICAMDGNLQ